MRSRVVSGHARLASAMPSGGRLGYDPWLHTVEGLQRLAEGCKRCGATLLPLPELPSRLAELEDAKTLAGLLLYLRGRGL